MGFAAEGANVSICARNTGEVAATVAALTPRASRRSDRPSMSPTGRVLAARTAPTAAELDGLDALVCNVSALAVGDTAESWERSFAVDMMHTVNAVRAAVPHLRNPWALRSS